VKTRRHDGLSSSSGRPYVPIRSVTLVSDEDGDGGSR